MAGSHRVDDPTISVSEALSIVASFFDDDWRNTKPEEVTVMRMINGYSSILHLVTRSSAGDHEPRKVLLRNIRGNFLGIEPLLTISPAEQAIVFYEMSRRGWGPKLYGISSDNRVEEFIECHTLTPAEAADPRIRSQVARAYARLHSLDLPFARNKFDLWLEDLKEAALCVRGEQSTLQPLIRSMDHPDAGFVADHLFATDFVSSYDAIKRLAKDFKQGFCQLGTQFLNVLVRGNAMAEELVVLIDYETVMYCFRGFDIGSHFVGRMWRANAQEKLTGCTFPNLEERQAFCQEYLKALVDIGVQLGESYSVDNLLFESEVGMLLDAAFTCNLYFRHKLSVDFVAKNPSFLQIVKLKLQLFENQSQLLNV